MVCCWRQREWKYNDNHCFRFLLGSKTSSTCSSEFCCLPSGRRHFPFQPPSWGGSIQNGLWWRAKWQILWRERSLKNREWLGTKVFSCHGSISLLTFLQAFNRLNSNTWIIYSQKDSRTGIHFDFLPSSQPSPCGSQSFYYRNSVTQTKKVI